MFNLKRYGRGDPVTFRTPESVDEMQAWCEAHSHIEFYSNQGDARVAKVNGQVKRWKRDRSRIEVPIKYGMYECARFNEHDIGRVLIPVVEEE